MKCPDCGGTLGLPSMMDGHMHCLECDHVWDGEWLCRFAAALAASRRALTMAKREMRLPVYYTKAATREFQQADLERMVKAHAALKAARTAMDRAQGRSTR